MRPCGCCRAGASSGRGPGPAGAGGGRSGGARGGAQAAVRAPAGRLWLPYDRRRAVAANDRPAACREVRHVSGGRHHDAVRTERGRARHRVAGRPGTGGAGQHRRADRARHGPHRGAAMHSDSTVRSMPSTISPPVLPRTTRSRPSRNSVRARPRSVRTASWCRPPETCLTSREPLAGRWLPLRSSGRCGRQFTSSAPRAADVRRRAPPLRPPPATPDGPAAGTPAQAARAARRRCPTPRSPACRPAPCRDRAARARA